MNIGQSWLVGLTGASAPRLYHQAIVRPKTALISLDLETVPLIQIDATRISMYPIETSLQRALEDPNASRAREH